MAKQVKEQRASKPHLLTLQEQPEEDLLVVVRRINDRVLSPGVHSQIPTTYMLKALSLRRDVEVI
eukprot:1894228-Amphidinium_carterae.1